MIPYDQFSRMTHQSPVTRSSLDDNYRSELHKDEDTPLSPCYYPLKEENSLKTYSMLDNKQGVDKTDETRLDKAIILQPFGKNQLKNAETILRYVDQSLGWNNIGEIVINDKTIKNSHITDLIKDSLSSYRKWKPTGYVEFYSSLKNLPLSLVKNKDRRHLIGKGNENVEHLPPPGVPVNKESLTLESIKPEDTSVDELGGWIKNWKQI